MKISCYKKNATPRQKLNTLIKRTNLQLKSGVKITQTANKREVKCLPRVFCVKCTKKEKRLEYIRHKEKDSYSQNKKYKYIQAYAKCPSVQKSLQQNESKKRSYSELNIGFIRSGWIRDERFGRLGCTSDN